MVISSRERGPFSRLIIESIHRTPGALWLLSFLILFSPLLEGGTTHVAVFVIRLLILCLFGVYLWDCKRKVVPWCSFGAPFFWVFVAIAAVATFRSVYSNQSLQWLVVLGSYGIFLHLVRVYVAEWSQLRRLLAVFLGIGVIEAGWALAEALMEWPTRPNGTFVNPNFLAGYLTAITTMAGGYLIFATKDWWRPRFASTSDRLQLLLFMLLGSFSIAIIWAASRGAMLALIAGLSLVVAIRYGRKGVGTLAVIFVIVMLVPGPFRERIYLEHTYNPLSYARWEMWRSSWAIVRDYPTGIGLGLYQYVYPRYALPMAGHVVKYGWTAQTAHGEYVQLAVECGLAAVLVFGWGIVSVARGALLVLKRRLERGHRGAIVGVCGALAGMLVHAAVDSNFHQPAIALLAVFCAGVLLPIERGKSKVGEPVSCTAVSPRWMLGIYSLIFACMALLTIRFGLGWIMYDWGKREFSSHHPVEALAHYGRAISIDPGKALYHNSTAAAHFTIFQQTGNPESAHAAIAELQAAIALNPLDGRLFALLGHVYAEMAVAPGSSEYAPQALSSDGWFHLAIEAYENASKLEPFAVSNHVEIGRLNMLLGQMAEGERAFLRAKELEPNYLLAREWLVRAYLRSRRLEAAEEEYQEIVERQQKYSGLVTDPLVAQYLSVDTSSIRTLIEQARMEERGT